VLESRDAIGGTWDLFRYPGIRSDSDLYTFGYAFKPWTHDQVIADGASILEYLHEVVAENDLDPLIRYGHRVVGAHWSTPQARWCLEVVRSDGTRLELTCSWIFAAGGYYRYDHGYTPRFDGLERFSGTVVHPQQWPDDLDCSGRRVVVIGSGATAVTLVPALARTAAHVTMLQRTPTYVMPVPSVDRAAQLLRRMVGDERTHALMRRRNIARQRLVWQASRRCTRSAPDPSRQRQGAAGRLSGRRALQPAVRPVGPAAVPIPTAAVRRDLAGTCRRRHRHGVCFDETGVVLGSRAHLDADIIVTATGLVVQPMGGFPLTVDGRAIGLPQTLAYKGFMLSGVPNLAYAIGYTNSSWTLKVGLLCEHWCRLLSLMDVRGAAWVVPEPSDPSMPTRPFLDFGAGYIRRAVDALPRQGERWPWQTSMTYRDDVRLIGRGDPGGPELVFGRGEASRDGR
jgi:cation diffusion facilitator CzcD-associated flavoprotein CzcO